MAKSLLRILNDGVHEGNADTHKFFSWISSTVWVSEEILLGNTNIISSDNSSQISTVKVLIWLVENDEKIYMGDMNKLAGWLERGKI